MNIRAKEEVKEDERIQNSIEHDSGIKLNITCNDLSMDDDEDSKFQKFNCKSQDDLQK